MKVKVRVKGIILNLVDLTDLEHLPIPLIIFMASLLKPKAFIPDNFLTPFELNRMAIDHYGAILYLN